MAKSVVEIDSYLTLLDGDGVREVAIYYDRNGFPFGEIGQTCWKVRRAGEEVWMVGNGVIRTIEGAELNESGLRVPDMVLVRGEERLQMVIVRHKVGQ